MSRGKRYDGEQKLNVKKVFAVLIAIAVIAMFIIGIKELLKTEDTHKKKLWLKIFPSIYRWQMGSYRFKRKYCN